MAGTDTNKTVTEKFTDTITDKRAPIGEEVPEAPFAIAGLTYLVILGLSMAVIGTALWLMS